MASIIENGTKIFIEYCDLQGQWVVTDENYDAETDDYGTWYTRCPVGYGTTQEEALDDYRYKVEELG